MSSAEKRTFSLPPEHAAFIDAKVSSGAYASGSEVIHAGLLVAGSQAPAWEPSLGSSSFPLCFASSQAPASHPPSPHKSATMPRSRYRVQCDPCPHFLTATVNHWLPLFTRTETVNIVLDYIHQNPVKRGYVDQPEHWRYSSARNYAGQEGLIEVIRAW